MASTIVPETTTSPGPRFRPYASVAHHVTKGRYITSNDPRGYIPVYEYPLNGQWIMMDIDDGYILWTGIWKALGNSKADIVKMVESQPELADRIRRVRGGYLKIQGTWMPYEVALKLARRVAWTIRDDLVPLFGPKFPSTCLSPDQPGYGQIVASGPGRRRIRRNTQPVPTTPLSDLAWELSSRQGYNSMQTLSSLHSPQQIDRGINSPSRARYAPYPSLSPHEEDRLRARRGSESLPLNIPALSLNSPSQRHQAVRPEIVIPPILDGIPSAAQRRNSNSSTSSFALPPISALEDMRGSNNYSAESVLKRLREPDDYDDWASDDSQIQWKRRRSLPFINHPPSTWSHPRPNLTGPPQCYPVSQSVPQSSALRSGMWPRHSQSLSSLHRLTVPPHFSAPDDGSVVSSEHSPISPATPQSISDSSQKDGQPNYANGHAGVNDLEVSALRVSSRSPPYGFSHQPVGKYTNGHFSSSMPPSPSITSLGGKIY